MMPRGRNADTSSRLPSTLLAIDTAGSVCSAAVARDGEVLAAESRAMRHGHGEALLPMLDRVVASAGLSPRRLDAIAVAVGPGGFTGIRVGLAAARGIALAVGAQLVGVSSFAAVAARIAARCGGRCSATMLVALDSRRADLYVQLFARGADAALAAAQAVLPADLADFVSGPIRNVTGGQPLLIAGDAAAAAAAALGRRVEFTIVEDSAPDAQGVAAAARRQLCSGAVIEPVRPLYLRPPDVTLPAQRKFRRGFPKRIAVSRRITTVSSSAAVPLAAMHGACFPEDPWDAPALAQVLSLAGGFGRVAWEGDSPAGFVLARDLGGEVEILSLGVRPESRRQGIGRALLEVVIAEAERRRSASVVLEVAASNTVAGRLYAALGFAQVGSRPHYYRDTGSGADALILRRMITSEPPMG